MKQMTCEMCEGTDFIKQDGVFVCQSCGIKYSVEEAKKMIVEVEGKPPAKDTSKSSNLFKLAQSSFDSKNYAKAEDFCNQVIAIDDKNYDAWKLKAEAVGFQTTVDNTRIEEIVNCLMNAYNSLDDKEKKEKKNETINKIYEYYKSDVEFNLTTFETRRPTADRLIKVKQSYSNGKKRIKDVLNELDLEDKKEEYLIGFANFFVSKTSERVESAWKTTVGYNYYRDYFGYVGRGSRTPDPFGARPYGKQGYVIDDNNVYKPIKATWDTFINETNNLIELLIFASNEFNDKTNPKDMHDIYTNVYCYEYCMIDSWSWKFTTGYRSRWDEYQSAGWHEEYCLTTEAKNARRKIAEMFEKKASDLPAEVERMQRERLEKERKEKADKYWSNHVEEKEQLESEKEELTKKTSEQKKDIKDLETELSNIEGKILDVEKEVKDMSSKKLHCLRR